MPERIPDLPLEAFQIRTTMRLRYCDTDRQGHINNSIFSVLCEAGRMELIREDLPFLERENLQFAIVRLTIDFQREMHWPGDAVVGTGLNRLGSSSIGLRQGIFAAGERAAMADSVIVLMDMQSRRPAPLPDALREKYGGLQLPAPGHPSNGTGMS